MVWVEGQNQNGKRKIVKAEITAIEDHLITFTPVSRKFKPIVFADSTLMYIGFTTTSRVITATTATIVLLPVCLIVSLLTQTPLFIILPARKDINFYNTMNGEKKWNIRIAAQ